MKNSARRAWSRKKSGRRWLAAAAVLLLLAAFLLGLWVLRYRQQEGIRFVKSLGNGINLGNSLDAHGVSKHKTDPSVETFETYWHNPPISKKLIRAIKEAGFGVVRIPVSWEEHLDEAGEVDEAWMDRVEEVVRQALDRDLYVILDTHHESWLDLSETGKETDRRFAALWTQIARRFEDCGEKLLFEGLNEPRKLDSRLEWSAGSKELRARVNELNEIFVRAVREAGGENNENRWLLIATYAGSAYDEVLSELKLPDRRCIVSVHVYESYDFCQKEESSSEWDPEGSDAESLKAIFENLYRHFTRKNIPVIVTECGCVDKDNEADRMLWVRSLREAAEACGASCLWWDNGSGYRLLDRDSGKILFPRLLRAFIG